MTLREVRAAESPLVSVVIPSVPGHDRSSTLERLNAQVFDGTYEVLIVVDSDLDRSAARNVGLRAASADIVALTDDDTKPPPDWISTIWAEFEADSNLALLEGRVDGGSRYRGTRHYVGCNLAVRREAALAVGGFSSRYADWAEDTEFGWRMERDADGICRYSDIVGMCHPTVPRTRLDRRLERQLRSEYPHRYETVIEANRLRWLHRLARGWGLTQPIHRLLEKIRPTRCE